MNKKNQIVLTSYFCNKPHPQLGDPDIVGVSPTGKVRTDDFSYIQDWYESLTKHQVSGVVFYDYLSSEFVEKYTNEYLSFQHCDTLLTGYTNNDFRFMCYLKYLEEHKYDVVYLTDGSDVVMVNDPSTVIDVDSADLFVCKDICLIKDDAYWNMVNHIDIFQKNKDKWDLLNMGVIGGTYDKIFKFLTLLVDHRLNIDPPTHNLNMPLGNVIMRANFENIFCGSPFTSAYKKHETDRTDVCFRHK